jgi:XRE family transcriptional regulator of biofilm formation
MLGTYIKRLRKDRNITLSQLAKKTNISKSYLSNIERNIQTNPSIGILIKISIALNDDIGKLIEASNSVTYLNKASELNMNDGTDIIKKMVELNEINQEILEEVRSVIESSKMKKVETE